MPISDQIPKFYRNQNKDLNIVKKIIFENYVISIISNSSDKSNPYNFANLIA